MAKTNSVSIKKIPPEGGIFFIRSNVIRLRYPRLFLVERVPESELHFKHVGSAGSGLEGLVDQLTVDDL